MEFAIIFSPFGQGLCKALLNVLEASPCSRERADKDFLGGKLNRDDGLSNSNGKLTALANIFTGLRP